MPWPLQDASIVQQGGALTATSALDTVVCGIAHTKGVWKELIASTTSPVAELWVCMSGAAFSAATDTGALFDIGVGAAASEVVIVPDVQCGEVVFAGQVLLSFRLPVIIGQGARVSIRAQCAFAAKTMTVQAHAVGGGFTPPESGSLAVTYGALTASSGGTLLNTPGTINTKATWKELSASTTARGRFALVTIQPNAGGTVTNNTGLLDIGVGAASSEQVVIANIGYSMDASERIAYQPITLPVAISEGTRLVARQQCSVTTATAVPRVAVTLFG